MSSILIKIARRRGLGAQYTVIGGSGPFAGYTRLSSLLPSLAQDDALLNPTGGRLLIDVEMDDSDRLGYIVNAAGGIIAHDPTVNTRILAAGIYSQGQYLIGTASDPYASRFSIDLCGARPTTSGNPGGGPLVLGLTHTHNTPRGNNGTTNDQVSVPSVGLVAGASRGFINDGGILKIYGQAGNSFRRLNAHYSSGTTIVLDSPVTAKAGDEIWVSPTGYFDYSKRTEKRFIAADVNNSTTVTLTASLGYARWGVLQYATDAGISLTQDAWTTGSPSAGHMKAHANMDPVIDQRAYVVIRNRQGVIRAYDSGNTSLASDGHGVHGMTMGIGSKTVLKNLQFNDYGQSGLLGRYGWHFHLPAYNLATGATLLNPTTGLSDGKYAAGDARVEGCTFGDGHNRGFVMHGCKGVEFVSNVIHRSQGHSFMEENGSEVGNLIQSNVTLRSTIPASGRELKGHEGERSSGFWFNNMDNKHLDNRAVDCEGHGLWNALTAGVFDVVGANSQYGCMGESVNIPISPAFSPLDVWDGNEGFCTQTAALSSQEFPTDQEGNMAYRSANKYDPRTDGTPTGPQVQPLFQNARLFKGGAGYFNRVFSPFYQGWKVCDNRDSGLSGATITGNAEQMLICGWTQNDEGYAVEANRPAVMNGMATYHGTLKFRYISAYNYPAMTPVENAGHSHLLTGTAVMEAWDLYLASVEKPESRDWHLWNAVAQFKTPSPNIMIGAGYLPYNTNPDNQTETYLGYKRPFSLDMAMYDPNGVFTTGPQASPGINVGVPNSYLIYNHPFMTYGITSTPISATPNKGFEMQAAATGTDFYGVQFDVNGDTDGAGTHLHYIAIDHKRLDSSWNPVAGTDWKLSDSNSIGVGNPLFDFHHISFSRGSRQSLKQPSGTPFSTLLWFNVYNLFKTVSTDGVEDVFYYVIDWSNSVVNPRVHTSAVGGDIDFPAATSLADFNSKTTGSWKWQDTTNNKLYLRVGPRPAGQYYFDGDETQTNWFKLIVG